MRRYLLFSLIPLQLFDQSKLESVLREIPSALIKSESHQGFVRKHYAFPPSHGQFQIKCQADYYLSSTIPSTKSCSVEVGLGELRGDEYVFTSTDSAFVSALYQAMPYGQQVKKVYSTERLYGQSRNGSYKQLFRYSLICKTNSCELSFSPKEALK